MPNDAVVISSGHGKLVRGASGYLDEVDEARRVVERVADILSSTGMSVTTFHDDTSTTQQQNLETIVAFHNSEDRDLDISVHFNAYVETESPMGTECLYVTMAALAADVADAIEDCGFINRGAKKRTDLYFLNNTDRPAILIEVCFVDSAADAELYQREFDNICGNIALAIGGAPDEEEQPDVTIGTASWFGGPDDPGVAPDEGLALYESVDEAPYLFLAVQPPGTSGLARRLNPNIPYIAMRWDYEVFPKDALPTMLALVRSPKTGRQMVAFPADWGPHEDTGRVADISPGLMDYLGIETDDEVEVIFPYERPQKA